MQTFAATTRQFAENHRTALISVFVAGKSTFVLDERRLKCKSEELDNNEALRRCLSGQTEIVRKCPVYL